jgi:hypothetical protein
LNRNSHKKMKPAFHFKIDLHANKAMTGFDDPRRIRNRA